MENTKESRLHLYKQALIDFKIENAYTNKGFCHYFNNKFGLYIYPSEKFQELLPELYSLKPNNLTGLDWYQKGLRTPRIKNLTDVINSYGHGN